MVALAVAVGGAFAFAQDPNANAPQTQTAPEAQGAPAKESPAKESPAKEGAAAKEMMAVVLSTNEAAKTITFKKETDSLRAESELEKTFKVEGKALSSLKSVRPGQTVKLQFKTDTAGKEVVTTIENTTTTTPEKKP
jgi:hypothetical protein